MPDKWLKDAWEFLFAVALGIELAVRHRLRLVRERLAGVWSVAREFGVEVAMTAKECSLTLWATARDVAVDYWRDVLPRCVFSHANALGLAVVTVVLSTEHKDSDVWFVVAMAAFATTVLMAIAVESVLNHRQHCLWIDYYRKTCESDRRLYASSLETICSEMKEAVERQKSLQAGEVAPSSEWQAKSELLDACRAAMEAGAFASEEEMVEFVRWSREEVAVAEMECDE